MPKGHADPITIAMHAASITAWCASNASRLTHYTPNQLEAALGMSMRALAGPLELLRWRRVQVWGRVSNRRVLKTYWIPPGGMVPRPQRGRPRYDLLALMA